MIGNIVLRLHDGFASLTPYATLRILQRAGHEFLVGEVAGQPTENVLACVRSGKSAEVLDLLARNLMRNLSLQSSLLLDLTSLTEPLTDAIHLALLASAAEAEELLGVPAASNPPKEEAKKTGQKRQSFLVCLGLDTPAQLFHLIGKTVADVQISRDNSVGIVVES